MKLFIARSHKEAHELIKEHELDYDHKVDKVISTTGAGMGITLQPLVLEPSQIYLLGNWTKAVHGKDWESMLSYRLARTRHTVDECNHVGR
jgi:predicted solute-binding protein